MKNFKKCILFFSFIFLIFSNISIFAVSNTVQEFNVGNANQRLDKLSIALSISQLNVEKLKEAVTQLSELNDQARECVRRQKAEINNIDQKLSDMTKISGEKDQKLTIAQEYLQGKKETLTKQQSSCQLFVLRSDEAINAFSSKVRELSTRKLLKTEPTFWSKIATSKTLYKNLRDDFNVEIFTQKSGLEIFRNYFIDISLGVLLFFLFSFGYLIKKRLKLPRIKKDEESIEVFGDRLKWIYKHISKKYVIPFFLILGFSIFVSVPCLREDRFTLLFLFAIGLLVYKLSFIILEFLFYPINKGKSLTYFDSHTASGFLSRLKMLTGLCFIGYLFYILFLGQKVSPTALDFLRTLFITFFSINLIMILWIVNRLPKILEQHKFLRISISLILTALLLTLLTTEWLGYKHLMNYILKGITLSIISTFLAWILFTMISGILKILRAPESGMRHYLHFTKRENIPEIIWFNMIFFILIWGGYILGLLKIWGLSEIEFRKIINVLSEGFQVANLKFVPSRIFFAFVLFSVLFTSVRWIRIFIERKWYVDKTIDTIVAYISTTLIFIISLLVAGVNFEGLAIIAGALSVGIGFGLQSIVNNFVSGIILLVEKPIKPGDRVVVEGTEGYVKKISIRSTQIQALDLSNIIVPNADLVSKNVINLSLRSDDSRIGIIVGVAYNSDVELVKKVLLEVANANPEVVTEDPSKQPSVFFMAFEASSLRFELYCTIEDVNAKYRVTSELYTAVNKALKEHKIEIPYPRTDVKLVKN